MPPVVSSFTRVSPMSLDDELALELWYKFDESSGTTVTDSSSHGRDGTLETIGGGGSASTWMPSGGRIDGALKFDEIPEVASDVDYVVAPDEAIDGLDDFTLAFWINDPVAPAVTTGVVVSAYHEFNERAFYLGCQGGSVEFATEFGAQLLYHNTETQGGSVNLYNPGWHHLAVTRSGTTLKYYVNGWLRQTWGFNGDTILVSNDTFRLGYQWGSSGTSQCTGLIDDFRIYSRALSDTEIACLALLDLDNDPCLKVHYEMEENIEVGGSALDVIDSSWYAQHALIVENTPGVGPTWDVPGGQINGALDFGLNSPFVDNYEIDPPDTLFDGLDDYTVAFWAKRPIEPQSTAVAFTCMRDETPFTLEQLEIRPYTDGVIVLTPAKQSGFVVPANPDPWGDDEWHHICLTRHLSDLELFFDGVSIGTDIGANPLTTAVTTSTTKLCETGANNYTGEIDDFRIYCRVLDGVEIRMLAMAYMKLLNTEIFTESNVTATLESESPDVILETDIDTDSIAVAFFPLKQFSANSNTRSIVNLDLEAIAPDPLEMQITIVDSDLFRELEVEE